MEKQNKVGNYIHRPHDDLFNSQFDKGIKTEAFYLVLSDLLPVCDIPATSELRYVRLVLEYSPSEGRLIEWDTDLDYASREDIEISAICDEYDAQVLNWAIAPIFDSEKELESWIIAQSKAIYRMVTNQDSVDYIRFYMELDRRYHDKPLQEMVRGHDDNDDDGIVDLIEHRTIRWYQKDYSLESKQQDLDEIAMLLIYLNNETDDALVRKNFEDRAFWLRKPWGLFFKY